jgi:hypothetical protein
VSLRRLLGLLVGLIYRLIVLLLFERWIPFPAPPPAHESKRGAAPPKPRPAAASGRTSVRGRPAPGARAQPRPPIFDVRLAEPAPERVAALESAHLSPPARVRPLAVQDSAAARPLRVLLRDRQALRSALLLGEVFANRRVRPK